MTLPHLEEVVEPVVAVKAKKARKPKKAVEPEPEHLTLVPVVEEPVSLPVVEPEPEPVAVCESCGEEIPPPFTDAEMDVYRRINAYKRKQLRLKKVAFVSADV